MHVPGRRLPAGTMLLAVADSLDQAAAALAEGADLIDLRGAAVHAVAEFRRTFPGVLVCCDAGEADLVRHSQSALAAGALLLCADPAAARASGLPADRLVVEVGPGAVPAAAAAGWAALVDTDRAAQLADPEQTGPVVAGIVAIAALSCWLGAAVVATRHVRPVRRALDMTASIRGTRPPARAVRGLA